MRPIRILICLEDLCFGGTQRQTLAMARRLDPRRFAVQLLVLTGKTDLDGVCVEAGLPVTYLGKSRAVHPLFFALMPFVFAREKPDIILPATALPNIWCRLWGKVLGIPVLGTCRGGGGPVRQHERFLWRLTAHMVCNTFALQEHLLRLGVAGEHITVIENGIVPEEYQCMVPPSKRERQILCVARLCADKDHLTLFRAFARIAALDPMLSLLVVGDGPDEEKLKRWAGEHSALPIVFHPGTRAIAPFYAKAQLFALTSVREGQPNVLLEAMCAGLPVCATRVGGIPAMVEDGRTGYLVERGDDATLALRMRTLLEHPEACDRMGEAGRQRVVEHHSIAAMVAAHEALFERYARM
ncbi:MAG: glycosyltransferase [Desulfovibrio sp.]|nr:glycosyltransferase [Desulfovibrio sp.]